MLELFHVSYACMTLCIKYTKIRNIVDFLAPRRDTDLHSTLQHPGQFQLVTIQGQATRKGKFFNCMHFSVSQRQ